MAGVGFRALKSVGGAGEEVPPERLGDELKEGKDAGGTDGGERVGGSGEQEVEEAKTERVALGVEAEEGDVRFISLFDRREFMLTVSPNQQFQ